MLNCTPLLALASVLDLSLSSSPTLAAKQGEGMHKSLDRALLNSTCYSPPSPKQAQYSALAQLVQLGMSPNWPSRLVRM